MSASSESKATSPVDLAIAALSERITADDQIPSDLRNAVLGDLKSDAPAALVKLKAALAESGDGNAS